MIILTTCRDMKLELKLEMVQPNIRGVHTEVVVEATIYDHFILPLKMEVSRTKWIIYQIYLLRKSYELMFGKLLFIFIFFYSEYI